MTGRQAEQVIMYLSDNNFVDQLSTTGITIGSIHKDVTPVVTPIRKVLISKINPEVPDRIIMPFLEHHGKIVKPPVRLSARYSTPQRHVLSVRRQCGVILTETDQRIEEEHRFDYEGRSHRIFISTDGLICFQCRSRGHIARNCPEKDGTGSPNHQETPADRSQTSSVRHTSMKMVFSLCKQKEAPPGFTGNHSRRSIIHD